MEPLGFFLAVATSSRNISPPEPLPLGGYTSRKGALGQPGDPLAVRVLAMSDGSMPLIVVAVETLTMPEGLYESVKAKLPAEVPLFMVATHTHCAPDSQLYNPRMTLGIPGIADYRQKWHRWMTDEIAKAVMETTEFKVYESVGIRTSLKSGLNRNRRGGVAPSPFLTQFVAEKEGRESVLFSAFAAHPTLLDEKVLTYQGDWPGKLAQSTGAMAFTAAIGDASPGASSSDLEAPTRFADQLVKASKGGVTCPLETKLSTDTEPIELDPVVPHPQFAKEFGAPEPFAKPLVSKFAPATGSITSFAVGKFAVVGVPGEPSTEIAQAIEAEGRRLGFHRTLVVSHVNGWIGYILTEAEYHKGGYEAVLGFHGPKTGSKVIQAAYRSLHDLADAQFQTKAVSGNQVGIAKGKT